MNPSRIMAVVLRQLYLFKGSTARTVPLFVWVAINIILWGFISTYLTSISMNGMNFISIFLGAVLLWEFLSRVMLGVTTAFMEDIWSRNFLNVFASPIKVSEYVTGLVIISIATSMVGLFVMLLLATLVFGLSLFAYGILLVPFILVLFLFGIALGIFGSAIMLRFGPAAEWFIWPLPALVSPFAAVFYPVSVLPEWMQFVAHLVPPSYVFEGMRSIMAGEAVLFSSMLTSLLLAIGYILAACAYFVRVYRHSVRTGLIARYSAESIG